MILLFQGDSITDGGRKHSMDANHILGHGYQYIVSAKLALENCQRNFKFINKGVTGNTIDDVYARLYSDVIPYKPDIVSFLVGINDIERGVGRPHGDVTDNYISTYSKMLNNLKSELPDTKIVICEPFFLEIDNYKEPYKNSPHILCEEFFKPLNLPKNEAAVRWKREEIKIMQSKLKDFTDGLGCIYVPLQREFDKYANIATGEYFVWDNVHPTVAGHELIARAWLKSINIQ